MCNEIPEEIIEKMYRVGIDLNIAESLSRILVEVIRDGNNLKSFDTENLSSVLRQKIIQTKEEFNSIEIFWGI